jgi:aminocarboxymuconate-semialdehyde decarboxylase
MSECIDVHNHIVPENFPAYAGKNANVPWPSMAPAHACHKHVMISGKIYRTVSDGSWSPSRRIADMDGMGVTRQALSPMPELLSYWLPLDDAKVLVRYLNDQIAAMIAEAPERFVGLGCIPLQDIDSSLKELEYVRKLGFAGVEIASHVNGTSIGDPRFEPFFAQCERDGHAIFVHALRPAGQDRIVGTGFIEQAVCFPGDIGLAAASMITGGIAAKHPKLRIAFSHGGGVMSILLPRLQHAWKKIDKARDSVTEAPEVTAKRFFYDQLVFQERAVRFVIDTFGKSQILVGTDYPYAMGDFAPLETMKGLDADTRAAITSANARRFLNLR